VTKLKGITSKPRLACVDSNNRKKVTISIFNRKVVFRIIKKGKKVEEKLMKITKIGRNVKTRLSEEKKTISNNKQMI